MKTAVRIILVLAAVLAFNAALTADDAFEPGKGDALKWKDYDKEFPKHTKKKKPVLIYFFSEENSGLCKHFEENVFTDKSVKSASGKFLCIRLHSEKYSQVAEKFGIDPGKAAIVVVDFQDKVIESVTDSVEAKDFAAGLKKAAKTNASRKKLLKKVEKVIKKSKKLLKIGRFRDAYAMWEWLATKEGEIKSENLDEILAEYKRLLSLGESEAKRAVAEVNRVYGKYYAFIENANRQGSSNTNTNNTYINEAAVDINKALYNINKVVTSYPFRKVLEITKAAQRKISEIAIGINALKNPPKDKDESKKP